MLSFRFLIIILLTYFVTINPANASLDPFESAGLRHLFNAHGGFFLLDYDRSQGVVNLTPTDERAGDKLVLDDFRNGFRVLQNTNVGIGIEVPINYALPVGFTVGLDLLSGVNVSYDRFAATRDDIAKLSDPRLPKRAADLQEWTTGDNVVYMARGGVGFAVGMGFTPIAGAAAYYFVEGDWIVYVEKTENNHVYVKLTNAYCQSVGALFHSVPLGLDVGSFREADRWFSFSYDLSNDGARRAYEDALNGSLGPSEKMTEAKLGYVERVMSSKATYVGKSGSWYFGIPLFGVFGGKSGKVQGFERTDYAQDGSRSEVYLGTLVNHRYSAGLLSKHVRHLNDFIASKSVYTSTKGDVTRDYSGRYLWAFESERVSSRKLERELNDLAVRTGVDTLRSISLPAEKHLGYVNVKFSAEMPAATVDFLMDFARTTPDVLRRMLNDASRERMNQYFESHGGQAGLLCSRNKSISPSNCEAEQKEEARLMIERLVDDLQGMDRAKDSDPKAFVRHFAEFGGMMTTNSFVFHEVLQLTTRTPMKMTLIIEGERISRFKRSINPGPTGYALQ